jgi:hypothetical protein
MTHFRIGACVLVFSTMSAVSALGQPGTAGANRPKLQVLQALPEAQLFPLMNFVADSLGVRCDYCHVQATPDLSKMPANVGGWVWDSDDKPAKVRARDMMKMVVALNGASFGGRAQVTCYTCHRGAERPNRLPPLPPAGDYAKTVPPPPLPTADRVWSNYVSAVGKVDTGAFVIKGWDDRSEGRYGRFEITVAGTDRYRIALSSPEGTTNQGLNADGAWVAANNKVQQLTDAPNLARMRHIAMRYRPLKERPANLRIVGVEHVSGRDTFVARARIDQTTTPPLSFDVVTGLLRRESVTTETLLVPLEEQVDYDDYRDVGGAQLPFRIRISEAGAPYNTSTRTIMDISRVPVDDAVFRPPQ